MISPSQANRRRQLLRLANHLRLDLAAIQGDFEGVISRAAQAQESVNPAEVGAPVKPGGERALDLAKALHAEARDDSAEALRLITDVEGVIARLGELRPQGEAAVAESEAHNLEISDRRNIGRTAIYWLAHHHPGMSVDVILTYPDDAKALAAAVRADLLRPDLTDHDILHAMVAERKRGGGRVTCRTTKE